MPSQPSVATAMIRGMAENIKAASIQRVALAVAATDGSTKALTDLLIDLQWSLDTMSGELAYAQGLAVRLQQRIDTLEAIERDPAELIAAPRIAPEIVSKYKIGSRVLVWWTDYSNYPIKEKGSVDRIDGDILYGHLDDGTEFMRAADVCVELDEI